jgi:hypothetical protein
MVSRSRAGENWRLADFLIRSGIFHERRTYRQPEVVFISLPQAATGLRFACRARSVGGSFRQTISWRPAGAAGGTLRGAFHAGCYTQDNLTQRTFMHILFCEKDMTSFHYFPAGLNKR